MTETTANYDEPWKAAIGEYLEAFLSFFFPEVGAEINWEKTPLPLEQELAQITAAATTLKRFADKLFKAWLLDGEEVWLLIHIEVQSKYDRSFPERMFIYNYRAFDLYHKPVISLAILGDPNQNWRPNVYQYGLGPSKMELEFGVAKLLDYESRWSELEESKNPLAVVVMAHLKTKRTTNNLTERGEVKWQLVKSLYEQGWERVEIANLFKFIDKMMTLPPELQSQFNSQLKEYEEARKVEFLSTFEEMAIERGEEQGAKKTSQNHILRILEKRFGLLPEALTTRINELEDITRLEWLHLETISVESLTEFQQLIEAEIPPDN